MKLKYSDSASSLLEFLVEKAIVLTLTCACREHGPRVTSRLFFAQRVQHHMAKMMTTKTQVEDSTTTMFDFRARNSARLSLTVVSSARGPRATSRNSFWWNTSNHNIAMLATKWTFSDWASKLFDFLAKNEVRLTLIFVCREHGPWRTSSLTFWWKASNREIAMLTTNWKFSD